MPGLAVSIPSGLPTGWVLDNLLKAVRNNRDKVYKPLVKDLEGICQSLTTVELDLHWEWNDFNSWDRRVLGSETRTELEAINDLLDEYSEEHDTLASSLRDTFEHEELNTEQNLPSKLTEPANGLTRFVTETTSVTGEITPERYIHDVEWLLLLGPFLVETEFLDGSGSSEDFEEELEDYVELHGLREELVESEEGGQIGLARNWWKRWSNWEEKWHEHLLDSKSNSEPGLWDVIEEHEQQFEEVERLRNQICERAEKALADLRPKTYPLPEQAAERGRAVFDQVSEAATMLLPIDTGQSSPREQAGETMEEETEEREDDVDQAEEGHQDERQRLTE